MRDHREITVEGWDDEPDTTTTVRVPPRPWTIEPHDGVDKKFAVLDAHGSPVMYFDYDDVWHPEVDLTAEYIVWAVNNAKEETS